MTIREQVAKAICPEAYADNASDADMRAAALLKAAEIIKIALPVKDIDLVPPKRSKLDFSKAKFGECHHCANRTSIAPDENDEMLCGGCADNAYQSEWVEYGKRLSGFICEALAA